MLFPSLPDTLVGSGPRKVTPPSPLILRGCGAGVGLDVSHPPSSLPCGPGRQRGGEEGPQVGCRVLPPTLGPFGLTFVERAGLALHYS